MKGVKIKILILEDMLADLELIVFELRQAAINFTHLHVETEVDFKKGLVEFKPDIILSDYNLPQFNGMEALQITKEIAPLTPFIIVTGSMNEETAVKCIKSGAWDYVLKENLVRLGSAINQAMERKALLEAKIQAEEELREKSNKLNERVKELNCLYKISQHVEKSDISNNDFFQVVADLIPQSWHYPEKTVCRLIIHEKEYKTQNFKKSKLKLCRDILVKENKVGTIEIYQLEKILDRDEMPFSQEEVNLFNMIAERLGSIIEHKKAEEALKESEERYANLFNGANDLIQLAEPDGKFKLVNKKWMETLRYTEKEVKDLRVTDIIRTDKISEIVGLMQNVKEGESIVFETVFISKSGKEIDVEGHGNGIFKDGKFISYFGIFRDITERKQAEEQIQQDLRVKTVLLQELYHRTKNNMQMVISILNRYSWDSDNEFIQTTFREMGDRIKSMSKVHQHLYNAQDLSNINLKKYIIDLVGLQAQSHSILNHEVSIKYDLEDVFLGIDLAIPLGLILTELISNVFKHAFPENKKGKLFIGLSKAENNIIDLKINDNGIGIPADLDLRKSSSTGLTLMFMLAEQQMKGEVNYRSENGLKWQIKVKENLHKTRV